MKGHCLTFQGHSHAEVSLHISVNDDLILPVLEVTPDSCVSLISQNEPIPRPCWLHFTIRLESVTLPPAFAATLDHATTTSCLDIHKRCPTGLPPSSFVPILDTLGRVVLLSGRHLVSSPCIESWKAPCLPQARGALSALDLQRVFTLLSRASWLFPQLDISCSCCPEGASALCAANFLPFSGSCLRITFSSGLPFLHHLAPHLALACVFSSSLTWFYFLLFPGAYIQFTSLLCLLMICRSLLEMKVQRDGRSILSSAVSLGLEPGLSHRRPSVNTCGIKEGVNER